MTKPRKAIVIAAGQGRRLAPHTDNRPKCLVPVLGESILMRQCKAFAACGIEKVVIVRGYLGHVLDEFAQTAPLPVEFIDNKEFLTNNVLHSLFYAESELDEAVLISYSDIIFTKAVAQKISLAPGDITLTVDTDFRKAYIGRTEHPLSEAEVAIVDTGGLVTTVGKKSTAVENASGEFIGLAKLTSAGCQQLTSAWARVFRRYQGNNQAPFVRAEHFINAYLTDLLQHIINDGISVSASLIRGQWREIDTTQDLSNAELLIQSKPEVWE